jgi:hypothetical protein
MHEFYALLNVMGCKLCFLSETECRFLSSSDLWADVSLPVASVRDSSDGRADVSRSSLLCYHCSDAVVATGKISVATVAYGPFYSSVL